MSLLLPRSWRGDTLQEHDGSIQPWAGVRLPGRFFGHASKESCVKIIESATSIIEYDFRRGLPNFEDVCPVLKALYKTSAGHSVIRFSFIMCCSFFVKMARWEHISYSHSRPLQLTTGGYGCEGVRKAWASIRH